MLVDEKKLIKKCATFSKKNKLVINMSETKEIVFYHPYPRVLLPLLTTPNIEQIKFTKLLGVFVMDMLGNE